MALTYLTKSNSTYNPKPYLRHYRNSNLQSLLKRKIADSNSHPKVLNDIHDLAGCPGEICGTLSGDAVQPLLAGAPECAQQDMADRMIDIAKTQLQDGDVGKKLIELAKIYRQTERNTFPDYSSASTPDTNSLFCQKEPKNPELSGLTQAQSKTADPNLFFDPKVSGKSVRKGSDARTIPFGQSKEEQTSSLNSTTQDNEEKTSQQEETIKTNPETGDVIPETESTKFINSTKSVDDEPKIRSSFNNSSDLVPTEDDSLDVDSVLPRNQQDQSTTKITGDMIANNQNSSSIEPNSDSNSRKSKHKIERCRSKNNS